MITIADSCIRGFGCYQLGKVYLAAASIRQAYRQYGLHSNMSYLPKPLPCRNASWFGAPRCRPIIRRYILSMPEYAHQCKGSIITSESQRRLLRGYLSERVNCHISLEWARKSGLHYCSRLLFCAVRTLMLAISCLTFRYERAHEGVR